MAQPPVVQERTISGKGVFRLDDEFRECKQIILYSTVLRPPSAPYLNVRYNPGKGFYANLTLNYRKYVGLDVAQNFPEQMFIIHQNDSQQVGASLVCALENILDSFVQYAVSEGIPYVKNNGIKEHQYSAFIYEEVKFVCYGGCALSLRIVGTLTDKCDPEDAKSEYPPPPPPPSQEPVPPGTPVEVDPPYQDEPPENPDTVPDVIDDPPTPTPCQAYVLNYTLISLQFPAPGLTGDLPILGEYEGNFEEPGSQSGTVNIGVIAGETVDGDCVGGKKYDIAGNLELPYTLEINSITPV